MSQKSEVVEELKDYDLRAKIVALALRGKQPTEIARIVGKAVNTVRTVLDDSLADVMELYLEQAERLHLMQLARLERLIDVAMPIALGEYRYTDDPEEKSHPDRDFIKLVKDLIVTEMDWEDRLYNRRSKNPTKNPDAVDQTIMAQDDMYLLAQTNMEQTWLEEYADMDAKDLIRPEFVEAAVKPNPAVRPEIAKLEKKVDKLLQESGLDDDDE